MKLGDLIKDNSWLSVEMVFTKIYPSQIPYLENHEAVFNQLRILKPKPSSINIIIENVIDEFDKEEYVSISGYDNLIKPKSEKLITESLALEFTPWAKWLGMSINQETLKAFSSLEIICHCLHEMTIVGFNQKEIDGELEKIKKAADDFKRMTKREKEKNSMTLEELKKKLKHKEK